MYFFNIIGQLFNNSFNWNHIKWHFFISSVLFYLLFLL